MIASACSSISTNGEYGNRALRLVATPEDGERAALFGLADELADERGLADAGFAADEHEPAVAVERGDELGPQRRHLRFAADEDLAGDRRGLADPHDLPQPPRFGEPLELVLADVVERHVGDRARELAGHVGHEDLAARTLPRTPGPPRARPRPRAARPATRPRRCSSPMRTRSGVPTRFRLNESSARWMPIAHATARRVDTKTARKPSPSAAFWSWPLLASICSRMSSSWLAEQRVGIGVAEGRPQRGRALDVREHQRHGTLREISPTHSRAGS